MGEKNVAVNQWLGDKTRFADLFNGYVFNGEKVHYSMPVRNMLYDALSYNEQIRKEWENGDNKKLSQEEYLSRHRKDKRLYPVITLVFYYGDKKWDAGEDLYDLFGWNFEDNKLNDSKLKVLKNYVPNYKINLVNPCNMKDLKRFRTDLQLIFEMLQYKNDKNSMIEFVHTHKDYFSAIDSDTYNAVRHMFNLQSVLDDVNCADIENGEAIDMCKAFDDYFNEGVERGVRQGMELGKHEKAQFIVNSIQNIMQKNYSLEEACELIGISTADYEAAKELGVVIPNA